MKEKDFVYISFTGRTKDTDEIFDTTDEENAKLAGIHDPKTKYHPIPVIVGANQVIPGLEDAIREMNVGEKKKVTLTSDKAFGGKNPELVRLLPMSIFKDNNLQPAVGRTVNLNGVNGRILSIDGGRVKVDFNHPLAGREIEYDLEIKNQVTDDDEKIQSVVKYYTSINNDEFESRKSENQATINMKKVDLPKQVRKTIADTIMKWVDGISKVVFEDVFEK